MDRIFQVEDKHLWLTQETAEFLEEYDYKNPAVVSESRLVVDTHLSFSRIVLNIITSKNIKT